MTLKQGDRSSPDHFSTFKALIAEKDVYQPVTTDVDTLLRYRNELAVAAYLNSISPDLASSLRSHILSQDPTPELEVVFSKVLRSSHSTHFSAFFGSCCLWNSWSWLPSWRSWWSLVAVLVILLVVLLQTIFVALVFLLILVHLVNTVVGLIIVLTAAGTVALLGLMLLHPRLTLLLHLPPSHFLVMNMLLSGQAQLGLCFTCYTHFNR